MNETLVVFGIRSEFVKLCIKTIGWRHYFGVSSSLNEVRLFKNGQSTLVSSSSYKGMNSLIDLDSGVLKIIYSGPFSRKNDIDYAISVHCLTNFISDFVQIESGKSIGIDLTILGSAEVATFASFDNYRLLKKLEFSLFLALNKVVSQRTNIRYLLLPTMTPSRKVGRFFQTEKSLVANRLVKSVIGNYRGLGMFRDMRYTPLNLLARARCLGPIESFKW